MKILQIPPSYRLSKTAIRLLSEIESNSAVISEISLPLEVERNIRRQSVLGSALFSARIEGNTLTRAEVENFTKLPRKDQQQVEVENLSRVIERILSQWANPNKKITKTDLLDWQGQAMRNILDTEFSSSFRTGHEGLFDRAGTLYYHAPPPAYIPALVDELLLFVNSKKEKLVPVRAILAHLVFEKIHPFVDGNGRVGRLLQLAILTRGGYAMKGLAVIEEEIEKQRQLYYRAIERSNNSDATPFVMLMLELIRDASLKAKKTLLAKKNNPSQLDVLSPRRQEIVQMVYDQRLISFDSIHRRFIRMSSRQIAYDLEFLIKRGYLTKVGTTRGALYAPKE